MLLKIRKNSIALLVALAAFTIGLTAAVAATVYRPSGGSTASSVGELKLASPFAQNFVIDKPVLFFPVSSHSNMVFTPAATETWLNAGTGTAAIAEVTTSEITGVLFDADNESHSILIPIPIDIDLGQAITFRAIWSNSTAAVTGSAKFYFLYKQLTIDTTAIAAAAGTMTTDGAADPDSGTAYAIQASPWSTLAASTLTGSPGDDFLIIKCYVDVTTITDAYLIGIQMQYSRRFLGGDNL